MSTTLFGTAINNFSSFEVNDKIKAEVQAILDKQEVSDDDRKNITIFLAIVIQRVSSGDSELLKYIRAFVLDNYSLLHDKTVKSQQDVFEQFTVKFLHGFEKVLASYLDYEDKKKCMLKYANGLTQYPTVEHENLRKLLTPFICLEVGLQTLSFTTNADGLNHVRVEIDNIEARIAFTHELFRIAPELAQILTKSPEQ